MKDDLKLQLRKIIKVKRDKVFAAWTEAQKLKQWFAPSEMYVTQANLDVKVGGRYTIHMEDAEKTRAETLTGTYKKIIPDELLIFTFKGSWQGDAPESLVTMELKDIADGTELTLTHEGFTTAESVKNHTEGWSGGLEKLAKLYQHAIEIK
jgi:uncharacterized protein YndB with AHSA1/START domain